MCCACGGRKPLISRTLSTPGLRRDEGGRGRFLPRALSRCSALAFVVFVDITGALSISVEAASEDRQETPASFIAKPPFVCDYVTTDLDARRCQRAAPRR